MFLLIMQPIANLLELQKLSVSVRVTREICLADMFIWRTPPHANVATSNRYVVNIRFSLELLALKWLYEPMPMRQSPLTYDSRPTVE